MKKINLIVGCFSLVLSVSACKKDSVPSIESNPWYCQSIGASRASGPFGEPSGSAIRYLDYEADEYHAKLKSLDDCRKHDASASACRVELCKNQVSGQTDSFIINEYN